MAIIGGLLAQNALMYLLKFGKPAEMLVYNGLINNFYVLELKMNPECTICCKSKEPVKQMNVNDIVEDKEMEELRRKLINMQ